MEDSIKVASDILKQADAGVKIAPRAISRSLLLSEDTFATVLLLLVMDTYPEANEEGYAVVLQWHPETLKMQIEDDFNLKLPKLSLDKLMAAITVLTTNMFYKSTRKFIEICNVFSGDEMNPQYFEPADAGEVLWGITEASIIYPPNDDKEDTEYSHEVLGYIKEVLKEEGIVRPPDILRLGIDTSAMNRIDENFADDPEMYGAIWKTQQANSDNLVQMVKSNLGEMAQQLKLLTLRHGSTESVVKKIVQIAGSLPEPKEEVVNF